MTHYVMCQDHHCKSRNNCFRFMATPEQYQAYADFERPEKANRCDAFIQFYGAPVRVKEARETLKLRFPA